MSDKKVVKDENLEIRDELFEPYYVKIDSSGNYTVVNTTKFKNEFNECYCSNLPSAMKAIIKLKIQNKVGVMTLKDYLTELYRAEESLKTVLKQFELQ